MVRSFLGGCLCALFLVIPAAAEEEPLELRVNQLIDQLGASQYQVRERAQAELEKLGLPAFDALRQAQSHEDLEISQRAQYLIRSMKVSWTDDSDSLAVRKILEGYGAQNAGERKVRMTNLAKEGAAAIPALCRLIRFESSDLLAKHASLLLLSHEPEPEQRENLSTIIIENMGLSNRSAAAWARAYAVSLVDMEKSLESWAKLTRQEEAEFQQTPGASSEEIVLDLLRFHAELLGQAQHREESLAVMRRTLGLIKSERDKLMATIDWLIEQQAWPVIEEASVRFPDDFNSDPLLTYRLAEAYLKQGKPEEANKTAEKAFAMNPGRQEAHVLLAYLLQDRGLFDWSEKEYRLVMEIGPAGSPYDFRARFLLSEMLHDQRKELPAAKCLQEGLDSVKENPAAEKIVEQLGRTAGAMRSRMHLFYANHFIEEKDFAKAQENLVEGIRHDPTDADLLIAMYRLPQADDDWKESTRQRIDTAVGHFRTEIRKHQQDLDQSPSEALRGYTSIQLASANNQYAWLVSNTYGDFEEALKCSQRSLELRPDTGGYFDTLGRCYYALKNYSKAVEFQKKAVELEPHSGAIIRQLELFEKALAAQQAGES